MPRQPDSRQRLLSVASELVWQKSYYGTTVDMICARCGIKKGSFYHHFASKEALMVEALDASWETYKQVLDTSFSASRTPVERFRHYTQTSLQWQRHIQAAQGKVLGCPLFSLGAEIGTQEPALRSRIDTHLSTLCLYFAATIREGISCGEIPPCDPQDTAHLLLAYEEGALTLARIQNDLTPLGHMDEAFSRLLRLPPRQSAAA